MNHSSTPIANSGASKEAQPFSVKRAQVEFHNFASLGEPERNLRIYADENMRRGAVIRNHRAFIGEMTPFLEMGANAGHSSYMLCNEFGAQGFALDLSADSLRHGRALMDAWSLERAPVRIAGDAANLPFTDGSLRFVCAFQMLSQFMDVESVFREVARVLAPGGVFLFAEEPLRRKLSLRLYRCPYYDTMKPWERRLHDWGLLGYLVRDVIGAHQEESFGIRQNHSMGLKEWHALVTKYFTSHEYEAFVPQRGWGERVVKRLAVRLDPHGSEWQAARWLGGTLAAVCKKAGDAPVREFDDFASLLRCPDCHGSLIVDSDDALMCAACGYRAANEGQVYNLLPSAERKELYPGERADIIDFSLPGHERHLTEGWYDLEGIHGNKYRWIGGRALAQLSRVAPGPQRLRIRGHASAPGIPGEVRAIVNGAPVGTWKLDRQGLFVLEADLPEAEQYTLEILASPVWQVPTDDRAFTVNLSMIRLVPAV
ncbi:MAG TPA: class I SAM-dependent methyltransferase [Bryobacteraceae bacterium]|nr:class I SAM-dependent methyltransferase [Bryobacteraceae bacterium]